MENAVGLSRPVKDEAAATGSATMEAGGVDTVCKYCGEDFKFYRSLKHHLRSESSCSHKPFTCRDCGLSFSTKASCLRHIQKQHVPVTGASVESRMTINEVILAAQQKAAAAACLKGPPGLRKRGLEVVKDRADKIRRLDVTLMVNGTQLQKQELMDISVYDEPLDFSLKTMESHVKSFVPVCANTNDDEPMDLSIGAVHSRSTSAANHDASKFECSSPLSLVVASRRSSPTSQSAASASESAMTCKWNVTKAPRPYQCTHCHVVFAHNHKVQRRSLIFVSYF